MMVVDLMERIKNILEANLNIKILDMNKSLTEYDNVTSEMILYLLVNICEEYNISIENLLNSINIVSPYEIVTLCNTLKK